MLGQLLYNGLVGDVWYGVLVVLLECNKDDGSSGKVFLLEVVFFVWGLNSNGATFCK